MYEFEYAESVYDNLHQMRAFERTRVLDEIEEQLSHEPTKATRNKKLLVDLVPPWQPEGQVWQLRVGKYRVFYEVKDEESLVVIRAIREKPPHKTTEEIL